MALDRYERTSLLQKTEPITDAGARQALASSQSLQARLDSISAFALGELQTKATQEGQLYGVKTAPTLKQVAEAVKVGDDVRGLFAKEGSVFGDAARKVQGDLFRQDSYANFASQIETISKNLDKGGLITLPEVDKISNEIQANINATVELLKDIDPEQAVKFNASAHILGNTLFDKINTKALELEGERRVQQVSIYEQSYKDNFAMTLIQSGGDLATAKVKMAAGRQELESNYALLPDGAKKVLAINELDESIMAETIGQIFANNRKYYDNFDSVYRALASNNPPEEMAFYNEMTRATKLKVLTKLKDENRVLVQIGNDKIAKEKLDDTVLANELAMQYIDTKDPKILVQLKEISSRNPNAISFTQIRTLQTDEKAWKIDPEDEFTPSVSRFKEQIINGDFLTYDDMQRSALAQGHSQAMIDQVFSKNLQSKQVRLEEAAIKDAVNRVVNPGATKNVKAKTKNRIQQIVNDKQEEATINGTPFNQRDAIDKATKQVMEEKQDKRLSTKEENLQQVFEAYRVGDIYDSLPKSEDGRLIIDMQSPEMAVIIKEIREEKGDNAARDIFNELSQIQNLRIQQDNR